MSVIPLDFRAFNWEKQDVFKPPLALNVCKHIFMSGRDVMAMFHFSVQRLKGYGDR